MSLHGKYRPLRSFFKKIARLVFHPAFIALTVAGNLMIVISSVLLYKVEYGVNPHMQKPLDAVWWAVSTVTTVGYGDIVPVTDTGKIAGIVLMLFGIATFWSYTALFAQAFISNEISDIEGELRTIDRQLRKISQGEINNNQDVKELVSSIHEHLQKLK